jgi:hypothetical protein
MRVKTDSPRSDRCHQQLYAVVLAGVGLPPTRPRADIAVPGCHTSLMSICPLTLSCVFFNISFHAHKDPRPVERVDVLIRALGPCFRCSFRPRPIVARMGSWLTCLMMLATDR